MLAEKFDPYGEILPDDSRGKVESAEPAPSLILRLGQLAFWMLVVAIVYARIRYFPAGFTF